MTDETLIALELRRLDTIARISVVDQDDLAQEARIALWRQPHAVRPAHKRIVVRHAMYDYLRRDRLIGNKRNLLEHPVSLSEPGLDVPRDMAWPDPWIWRAVRRTTTAKRAATIIERFRDARSRPEIAARLGVSRQAVWTLERLALADVRRAWGVA